MNRHPNGVAHTNGAGEFSGKTKVKNSTDRDTLRLVGQYLRALGLK